MASSSVSFSPSKENLLCRFDLFCINKGLSTKEVDKASKTFFAWCMQKGYDNCVFPEYLAGFAKGDWSPDKT